MRLRHTLPQTTLLCALLGLAIMPATPAAAQQQDALDGLVREALTHNLGFAQQRLAYEKSAAAVTQARGLLLPSVTIDARYSETNGSLNLGDLVNPAYQALNQMTGTNQFPTHIDARLPYAQETRLRIAQPLFQPAALSNYSIQKNLRGAAGTQLRGAARNLAADVQLAYVNYAQAQKVVDLYRNTLVLVGEAVRVNERLLANGKITPAALHRASADRSEVEQKMAQAEQQRNAARRYCNFLLGRAAEAAIDEVADSLLLPDVSSSVQDVISHALSTREEIQQATWGIKAYESQARLTRAAFLPSIALAVDYGVQGNDYRFDNKNDVATASLVLSWNLFNGGQDAARRQQADIDVARGELGRRQAEQQIELQVRQAYDGVVVAKQAIDAAQDRMNAARRSFELMRRRYTEGVASQLEFVDARTTLTNAELNWILTRYQYVANYIELERVAALRVLDLGDGK